MGTNQIDSDAMTGYEAELWAMADTLRGSMDAAEYKHVVLGLIFLKYNSDAFDERRADVLATWGNEAAEDVFWVPPEARWKRLKAGARQPTIGQTVDQAMTAIERDNPALKDTSLDEVCKHGHVLTPGRYVGVELWEDDGEPFDEKMNRLVIEFREQRTEGARLDATITENLEALRFWKGES